MRLRDRIKELRRVPASELVPNPKNYREHDEAQRDALKAALAEIGLADASLVRELPDGRLMLIDGHLRADLAKGETVPVLVLDVTEEEADKLLAILDPLVGMASVNAEAQRELLESIEAHEAGLRKMLADLLAEARQAEFREDRARSREIDDGLSAMELQPHEHYDYVIVLARSTHEWNRLCELLDLGKVRTFHGKIGVGRGLPASRLISLLEGRSDGDHADRNTQPAAGEEHAEDAQPAPDGDGVRRPKRASRLRRGRAEKPTDLPPEPTEHHGNPELA